MCLYPYKGVISEVTYRDLGCVTNTESSAFVLTYTCNLQPTLIV